MFICVTSRHSYLHSDLLIPRVKHSSNYQISPQPSKQQEIKRWILSFFHPHKLKHTPQPVSSQPYNVTQLQINLPGSGQETENDLRVVEDNEDILKVFHC